jgi:outer membrane protein, heavy metal efflux system
MQLNFLKHKTISAILFILFAALPERCPAGTLTRGEAVRLALEHNPAVQAALFRQEAARARLTQARALPDPEFELEYEELPRWSGTGGFGERSLGLSQTLELPQKWWLRNRTAGSEAEAARLLYSESAKLDLKAQVKTAFDRLLYAGLVLEDIRLNQELSSAMLEKAHARFRAGDVPRLELVRAEVEQARSEARLSAASREQDSARGELNALLGRDPHDSLTLSGALEYTPLALDEDSLRALALSHRPDLAGERKNLAAGRDRLNLARNSFLPDINLGLYRQSVRASSGNLEDYWRLRAGLELPLWGMFRQRGLVQEAAAEAARTGKEIESLRLRIMLEVDRALLELRSAAEQALLYRDRVLDGAGQAYRSAERGYTEGKASYLDLLEARRVLTETRIEYAGILLSYREALARLELATGAELE